jgi:hypothetical protein
MSAPSEGLIKWLKKQQADLTEAGAVIRYELWHSVESESLEKLDTFPIPEDQTADAEALAAIIWGSADNDVGTRSSGQPQRYVVHCYHRDDQEPSSAFPFLIRGRTLQTRLGMDTEPATEKGVIAHFMRHDEALRRQTANLTEITYGHLMDNLRAERERTTQLEKGYLDVIKLKEHLLNEAQERHLTAVKAQQASQRSEQMFGLVMTMAPILLSQFMSKLGDKTPEAAAVVKKQLGAVTDPNVLKRDALISELLKHLSNHEVGKIVSGLSVGNKIAFFELYKSYSVPGADSTARDAGITALLGNLSEDESSCIFEALAIENRERFLEVYVLYKQHYDAAQAQKPDIIPETQAAS